MELCRLIGFSIGQEMTVVTKKIRIYRHLKAKKDWFCSQLVRLRLLTLPPEVGSVKNGDGRKSCLFFLPACFIIINCEIQIRS